MGPFKHNNYYRRELHLSFLLRHKTALPLLLALLAMSTCAPLTILNPITGRTELRTAPEPTGAKAGLDRSDHANDNRDRVSEDRHFDQTFRRQNLVQPF